MMGVTRFADSMQTLPSHSHPAPVEVPPALLAPFVVLILLIAIAPLLPARLKHAWEKGYAWVSLGLGGVVAGWYLLAHPAGAEVMLGVLREYGGFIALIGALYVVAGGVHIGVNGAATPGENVRLLLFGAVLANLIGTTGASMVLIRPLLRMNARRKSAHHVIFFIFIVSNCGGALTPIGDPPLFLGYLRGVPFFWLMSEVWVAWAGVIGALAAIFWVIDLRHFRRAGAAFRAEAKAPDEARFAGGLNVALLAVVVGAVFIPGTVPWLREAVMLAAAAASYRFTRPIIHELNGFTFGPIREVAVLFAGIFLTMAPALDAVALRGAKLGLERPAQYYLVTGGLSSVLDNAPTYATFFELATATARDAAPERFPAGPEAGKARITAALLAEAPDLVVAVSLGAVFFGAMTYIGNGPNFMVKAIAEEAGVAMPGFFGYILRYALPCLLPVLLLAGWLLF
jgi:Na+/H+ antiporter NhaD/arsenite permease-like protein